MRTRRVAEVKYEIYDIEYQAFFLPLPLPCMRESLGTRLPLYAAAWPAELPLIAKELRHI